MSIFMKWLVVSIRDSSFSGLRFIHFVFCIWFVCVMG